MWRWSPRVCLRWGPRIVAFTAVRLRALSREDAAFIGARCRTERPPESAVTRHAFTLETQWTAVGRRQDFLICGDTLAGHIEPRTLRTAWTIDSNSRSASPLRGCLEPGASMGSRSKLMAVSILRDVAEGMRELSRLIDRADRQQAGMRAEAIAVIQCMCDALQAGADIVSYELSMSILELNDLARRRMEAGADTQSLLGNAHGALRRTATRLADPTLRLKFHEGQVCSALHVLGDRLAGPLGSRATSPAWESIRSLFTRSTSLSRAVHGLLEGEQDYLRDFVAFLDSVRDQAENGLRAWDEATVHRTTDEVADAMRGKRAALREQIAQLRQQADAVINAMH